MSTKALRNFINGESAPAADGRTTDLVNPSTGEVFGSAPLSGQADVDRAYSAAAAASRAGETALQVNDSRRC